MINASDMAIVLPELQPQDVFSKVGGNSSNVDISSDVDNVFQPGVVFGSDSSDNYYYQYRKVFLKNFSTKTATRTRVYGYNVKNNNIVKFALEKDIIGNTIIDGSDLISNYRIEPGLINPYQFTEIINPSDGFLVGGDGELPPDSAQGIWLRMMILKNISDCASEQFVLGYTWSDLGS